MEDNFLIKRFNTYFKKGVEVNGMKFYPVGVENGILVFRFENPNDLSYTRESVYANLHEELELFNKITDTEHVMFSVENLKSIYTNDEMKEYFESELSSIIKLTGPIYVDEDNMYDVIHVRHIKTEFGLDGDFVQVFNTVKPIKAFMYSQNDDELISEIPLYDAISEYEIWQNRHKYDETDNNYSQFDEFISQPKYRSYIDTEFQSIFVTTIFEK